jgi:hypothetical protein
VVPDPTNWKKYALVGAGTAIGLFAIIVINGAVWSHTHTKTLSLSDHIVNGFAFAKMVNILSLVLGFSIGLSALFHLSKNENSNFGIIGFVVTHFSILIVLCWAAPLEFRKDPLPERMIDRVLDFKDRLDPKD